MAFLEAPTVYPQMSQMKDFCPAACAMDRTPLRRQGHQDIGAELQ
jgi:hypothetical protein